MKNNSAYQEWLEKFRKRKTGDPHSTDEELYTVLMSLDNMMDRYQLAASALIPGTNMSDANPFYVYYYTRNKREGNNDWLYEGLK